MQTNVPGIYAIGDCTPNQALAHKATKEGINAAEHLAGEKPEPIDYNNVPGCTYCSPEVASVGYTEKAAKEQVMKLKSEISIYCQWQSYSLRQHGRLCKNYL